MDYEKKKIEALEELKQCARFDIEPAKTILRLFPELEESDYVIKQRLIHLLGYFRSKGIDYNLCDRILKWLEKQGKQKPVDKVEPKFKVSDWVVYETEEWRDVLQIETIDEHYTFTNGSSSSFDEEQYMRLWTIEDAKDGDVLVFDDIIMIFKNIKTVCTANTYILYCDGEGIVVDDWCDFGNDAHPATKEQRDLLFQKMKEVGYEWNDDEKALVMIGIDNNNEDEQYEELMGDDETDLSIEPINEYNTHEPTLEEAKEWNEAYEKGYSLGYENGKNERNPAWSEEDGTVLNNLIDALANDRIGNNRDEYVDWLKSLKDRVQPQWKPTEEQMEDLKYAINMVDKCCEDSLQSLYDELVKF